MYHNEVSVENVIIPCIFAEKGPYNMTMWFVVHLIVTDTHKNFTMRHGPTVKKSALFPGLYAAPN